MFQCVHRNNFNFTFKMTLKEDKVGIACGTNVDDERNAKCWYRKACRKERTWKT